MFVCKCLCVNVWVRAGGLCTHAHPFATIFWRLVTGSFKSATAYHSDTDHNSRGLGFIVVVVVVVMTDFKRMDNFLMLSPIWFINGGKLY